jgi:hypothetical protein
MFANSSVCRKALLIASLLIAATGDAALAADGFKPVSVAIDCGNDRFILPSKALGDLRNDCSHVNALWSQSQTQAQALKQDTVWTRCIATLPAGQFLQGSSTVFIGHLSVSSSQSAAADALCKKYTHQVKQLAEIRTSKTIDKSLDGAVKQDVGQLQQQFYQEGKTLSPDESALQQTNRELLQAKAEIRRKIDAVGGAFRVMDNGYPQR